jgi:hypothetical protein
MPHRAQLAFALMLLLVLAPLASAACGIACVTSAHTAAPAATPQPHCVRAATCCHSSSSAVCAATRAPEAIAPLPSAGTNTPPDTPAFAVITAESPLQNAGILAVRSIDTSPPGWLPDSPIPLRI